MTKRVSTAEAIAKRNAAFAKLDPAAKRVVVAKDVLAALNAKRITAKHNTYGQFFLDYNLPYETRIGAIASDAQQLLLQGQIDCTVCAIGAIFTCAVERINKLTFDEMRSMGKKRMAGYMAEFFSAEQLDLIECAFERTAEHVKSKRYVTRNPLVDTTADDELRRACAFDAPYAAEPRMRAIMTNIIANKGTFIP